MVAAAALGRLDLVRRFFDADGRLTSPLRRQGRDMDDRDAVGLAALYAYVRHQPAVVDYLLEKTGNWDMIGVNNGTLLHRAAWAGDLPMVQRLVALGADINNRNNPYRGTPMDWAWHNNQREAVQWIQDHCAVDLHNAVAYDLREQVAARLREDPASVNGRLDDGDIALGTPLHSAARLNRVEIAALLCDRGAYRDALAGDGTTPLDVAEAHGSAGVAALLDERGARRAGDAPSRAAVRARPAWDYDESHDTIRLRVMAGDAEWEAAIAALAEKKASGFDARGQMTDARLARVADVGHVTRIELEGSAGVSDAGRRAPVAAEAAVSRSERDRNLGRRAGGPSRSSRAEDVPAVSRGRHRSRALAPGRVRAARARRGLSRGGSRVASVALGEAVAPQAGDWPRLHGRGSRDAS